MYQTKIDFERREEASDEITPDERAAIEAWLSENEPRKCAPGETAFPVLVGQDKQARAEALRRFKEVGFRIMHRNRKFQRAAKKRAAA